VSIDVATSYPLTLRTPSYRWSKPVIGLLILVASAVLVAPLALMPLLAVLVALQSGDFTANWTHALNEKPVTPASLLYLNLTLAALILVAMMIVWLIHKLPVSRLMSIKPGIRWKFFFVCLGISVVAIAAQFVVAAILPGDTNGTSGHPGPFSWTTVGFIAVIAFSTPLQAMGEEYAFRGYAMQAFGSLTKSPWFAILLSAALFTAAHGVQNVPLLADRFAFGLLAGYLVLRTGGLEAGIALHVLNNLVAFGFALAFGDITSALNTSSASWWQLPVTVTQNGVYLLLVLWVAKRMGITKAARLAPQTPAV
jgi:membrane protease YdiL (CAAX protease family)